MKVVILAGGLGTRLSEETDIRPKPMVEIGGKPILWHIMKYYASQGFKEFALALGYKAHMVKRYFHEYAILNSDFTVELATGDIMRRQSSRDDWTVHLVDTGLSTMTGGRMKRLKGLLGRGTFMMTYGDGLSNVDLQSLLAFHRQSGKLATLTAVRPPARYGSLHLQGDMVTRFSEKPETGENWINGGFCVLEPEVLDYIEGDGTSWEREPLERLASEGQLSAYRHERFWQSMDTIRDLRLLESLWESGSAPWRIWD